MRRDQRGFARKCTNSKKLVDTSVAKTVATRNAVVPGSSGPGIPAKGMTASANIAYVQMKAILILKAERAGALRALIWSLSAPLTDILISSLRQPMDVGFSTYSFEVGRYQPTHCTTRLVCRATSVVGTSATSRGDPVMSASGVKWSCRNRPNRSGLTKFSTFVNILERRELGVTNLLA